MPFQLDGTSAIHVVPLPSVPVKCAVDADAVDPNPTTSVKAMTTTRSVPRSLIPRRFTTDLPCSCRPGPSAFAGS